MMSDRKYMHQENKMKSTFGKRLQNFVTGLGVYFSIVFTSMLLFVLMVEASNRAIRFDEFAKYMIVIVSGIYLLVYSFVTTEFTEVPLNYKLQLFAKRFFDVVVASIGAFFVLPVMLLIAVAIKIDSPGPVFHRTKRLGQFGRIFEAYTFRTQYQQSLTRIGGILHRYALDQWPLLYNVIEGTMSLVGPWPRLAEETADIDQNRKILTVKPGITGLWQISHTPASERVRYDLEYIENWSIWLDFRILLKTPIVVLLGGRA